MIVPASRETPRLTKGQTSAVRVPEAWYVLCLSRELGRRPLARTLLDTPLVLFRRMDGAPAALLDRCPHRNAPLSLGRVEGGTLECGYHGWRFDGEGVCRRVPGLCGEAEARGRATPAYPVREQDGFVWVYGVPGATPDDAPFRFPYLHERGYTTVRQRVEAEGTLHAVAENALDVPHTAFLHRGLFRGGRTSRIEVAVRRWHDRVEAEYIGEPKPPGLAGRILAPGAEGVVTHFDRFFLPSVVQVEYRLGPRSHFCVTSALTPVRASRTRLFAAITFRVPLPGWLVAPLLAPVARRIFAQDARVLARQAETIARFGGEQFVSTEVDVLGPHILRLLKSAERGERTPVEEPFRKTLHMEV